MDNDKFAFNITSVEDYLDVGIDPEMVLKIIEETPLEQFKPIYVTAYFLLKPDLVSS
jgi:hypothetical protein